MHLAAVPADPPAVSASAEQSALHTRTARGDEQAFAALYDSGAGLVHGLARCTQSSPMGSQHAQECLSR